MPCCPNCKEELIPRVVGIVFDMNTIFENEKQRIKEINFIHHKAALVKSNTDRTIMVCMTCCYAENLDR